MNTQDSICCGSTINYQDFCSECGEHTGAIQFEDENGVAAPQYVDSDGMLQDSPTSPHFNHKHGESGRNGTPEYSSYLAARKRCNDPHNKRYYSYGGRGIKFLFVSFTEFLASLGRKPSPKHSLDRIDNDGHYEPGNVRWATHAEQVNNRSVTHLMEVHKEVLTLSQWARRMGVPRERITGRLALGFCDTCAVLLPKRASCPHRMLSDKRYGDADCCGECFVTSHDVQRGFLTVAVPEGCGDEDCDCHQPEFTPSFASFIATAPAEIPAAIMTLAFAVVLIFFVEVLAR